MILPRMVIFSTPGMDESALQCANRREREMRERESAESPWKIQQLTGWKINRVFS